MKRQQMARLAPRPQSTPDDVVPAAAVLDNWAEAEWTDGCQVDTLPAMQCLMVITMNHVYEIIVIDGGEGRARVRGGHFFPDWREVQIAGCSLGGSFLKLRGIYVGFRLELHVDGEFIITSAVQRLAMSQVHTTAH